MAPILRRTHAMTVRVLVVDDEPDVEMLFRQLKQDIMTVMTDAKGGNG